MKCGAENQKLNDTRQAHVPIFRPGTKSGTAVACALSLFSLATPAGPPGGFQYFPSCFVQNDCKCVSCVSLTDWMVDTQVCKLPGTLSLSANTYLQPSAQRVTYFDLRRKALYFFATADSQIAFYFFIVVLHLLHEGSSYAVLAHRHRRSCAAALIPVGVSPSTTAVVRQEGGGKGTRTQTTPHNFRDLP